MISMEQTKPALRKLGFMTLNVRAARNAYELHLLSREFLLGFLCWVLSAGAILLQVEGQITLPEPLMISLKIFSVFAGCCWVVFPLLIYLELKMDRWVRRVITIGPFFCFLTGVTLWHQAARGKLSTPFFAAVLVDMLIGYALRFWTINKSGQALLDLAFFVNTVFYVLFPLLIFLSRGSNQRVQTELPPEKEGSML